MNSINIPTRRTFLHKTALAGLALPFIPTVSFIDRAHGAVFHKPKDLENLTDLEKIHVPKVTLPPVVEDGNQAPIVVEVDHPMDQDHYIKSIQILNFQDPVVIKGQCFFTPMSGQAYVSTQIRLAGGDSMVWVVVECNQDGKWAISKNVKVAAGGC